MSAPATPSQMAANNLAATEVAGHRRPVEPSAAIAHLRALLVELRGAEDRIDPHGSDAGDVAVLADWHDALRALGAEVSAILLAQGSEPALRDGLGMSLVDGIRSLVEGPGLKAVVADGTRLLDLLTDTIAELACPDARAGLSAQRAIVVDVVNRAQDRLDA